MGDSHDRVRSVAFWVCDGLCASDCLVLILSATVTNVRVHSLIVFRVATGRPRVNLCDRPPGPDAKVLGTASVLQVASPSSGLEQLGALVSEHMPALIIHGVDVAAHALDHDYDALELLYFTDAYQHLLDDHFYSKQVNLPRTMRHLCRAPDGAHRRLVVAWNARFVSAC